MFTHYLPLAILAGLGTIGFNTFNRQTLQKGHDSTVYAWLFEIMRILIFLPFLLFDYQVIWSWASARAFLLMGFTELVSVYLFMKMHSHSDLSLSSIFTRLRIIWTPIVGFLILGEILSPLQYLGILVIFLGCSLIYFIHNNGSRRGLIYALVFSLVNACSNVFVKQASVYASSSMITILFSIPAALFIPVIMRNGRTRISHNLVPVMRPLFAASLFNALTMFTLVTALHLAPAGQVTGISQGVATLSIFSGIFILGERDHKLIKFLAGLITTTGIILLV
ncbi:MAG: DMT family transporter [bacterium]